MVHQTSEFELYVNSVDTRKSMGNHEFSLNEMENNPQIIKIMSNNVFSLIAMENNPQNF